MAEVIILIAILAQEVSENGGGLLHHLSNVLRPARALATEIADGHPSSITPTMAWDMVHSRLTGNFTVDDWVAGLMSCLPVQFRTRAVVTPTYMWDTVDMADFLWCVLCSLFVVSHRVTRCRLLVLCFPPALDPSDTIDQLFLVLPLLHQVHFAISLLPALAHDTDGVAALVGFNHAGQSTLVNQADRIWLALTVLANPAVYPTIWAKLTALSVKYGEEARLKLASAFAIARLVINRTFMKLKPLNL
jgi:hypothetical protein